MAGETTGTRFLQEKAASRHGTDPFAQASDGTGIENNLAAFNANGGLKDSGISSIPGGGGTGGGGAALGSLYGQVPRGPINGANTTFATDYVMVTPFGMAGPWSILTRNGVACYPPIDGPNPNTPFEYAINSGDASITFLVAPKITDQIYISYLAGSPAGIANLAPVSTATLHVWSSFTGSAVHAFSDIDWFYPGGASTNVLDTNVFYSLQENTLSLTLPGSPTINSFAGASVRFLLLGSLLSIGDPNDINIYDVYIKFVLTDGSAVTVRPTSWSMWSGGGTNQFTWAPNTAYTSGTQIIDRNGNVQQASNSSTSGAIPPIWGTSGTTTESSGQTWTFVGAQTSVTGIVQNPTRAYDPDANPPSTFAKWEQSTWGGLVADGSFSVIF